MVLSLALGSLARRAPGGLFVLHVKALLDHPYDGYILPDVIDCTETLTGCAIERAYVDKGYRGHEAEPAPCLHLRPEARRLRCHQAELRRLAVIAAISDRSSPQ